MRLHPERPEANDMLASGRNISGPLPPRSPRRGNVGKEERAREPGVVLHMERQLTFVVEKYELKEPNKIR